MIVADAGNPFVRIRNQVAIGVVGVACATTAGVEAVAFLGSRGCFADRSQAVGAARIGIAQVVDLVNTVQDTKLSNARYIIYERTYIERFFLIVLLEKSKTSA